MLAAYDIAKEQSSNRKVKTGHGLVAEAEFRRWLTEFLPKRYAVTSGFIISPGVSNSEYMVHFDVIIYDQLESPVLWIENNSDSSDQGTSRAIPVEYVLGVIEVKSKFNKRNAREAVEQLSELKPLLACTEPINKPVKLYLPAKFFCATVFFELRKEDDMDFGAMDELVEASMLRGFYGGYILRSESLDKYYSGKISFVSENCSVEPNNRALSFWAASKSKKFSNDVYFGMLLYHSETHFSEFAFDIIAILKGTYHPHVLSSLYCIGTTQWENGSSMDVRYYKPEDVKRYNEETATHLRNLGYEGFEPIP